MKAEKTDKTKVTYSPTLNHNYFHKLKEMCYNLFYKKVFEQKYFYDGKNSYGIPGRFTAYVGVGDYLNNKDKFIKSIIKDVNEQTIIDFFFQSEYSQGIYQEEIFLPVYSENYFQTVSFDGNVITAKIYLKNRKHKPSELEVIPHSCENNFETKETNSAKNNK